MKKRIREIIQKESATDIVALGNVIEGLLQESMEKLRDLDFPTLQKRHPRAFRYRLAKVRHSVHKRKSSYRSIEVVYSLCKGTFVIIGVFIKLPKCQCFPDGYETRYYESFKAAEFLEWLNDPRLKEDMLNTTAQLIKEKYQYNNKLENPY